MSLRVVVVGGSAGSIGPLCRLVANLPHDLGACVLVTVHIPPSATSILPKILTREGPLSARTAREDALLQPNTITVAPPDRHLATMDGRVHLSTGPKVKRHRPSVDVMFRSAARWSSPDLIAVVLSGMLDDGADGAAAVARAGGTVLVQDPTEAAFGSMPRAALAAAPTSHTTPIARICTLLTAQWGR